MSLKVSWRQALAWRMQRQLLNPIGTLPVTGVVQRLCGVQAQVASSAELAIRVRQENSKAGEVSRALADGRLIKNWAMRGTLHLLTAEEGPAFLSVMSARRFWERPAWLKWYGVSKAGLEKMREFVREELDGKVLTRKSWSLESHNVLAWVISEKCCARDGVRS